MKPVVYTANLDEPSNKMVNVSNKGSEKIAWLSLWRRAHGLFSLRTIFTGRFAVFWQ